MRSAMIRRACVSGISVPRNRLRVGRGAAAGSVPALAAAAGDERRGLRPRKRRCGAAASTSSAVTRPFAPLPAQRANIDAMLARQTAHRRRAPRRRPRPSPPAAAAVSGRRGACAGVRTPELPTRAGSRRGLRRARARRRASSMTAIGVPVATVSPSLTRSSRIVPVTGEGTPALTFRSRLRRSLRTFRRVSPIFFSHCATVPSVTVSPSCGIVIVVAIRTSPSLASRRPSRPETT